MRRRDFLSGAAAGAAAPFLGWPDARAATTGWRLTTSLPMDHPALAALRTTLPLQLARRGADTELIAAADFVAGRPALSVLADLPFGPTPDRLVPWLISAEGAAIWRQAAGPSLLPVWAAPGTRPRFVGSELYLLRLADGADAGWAAAASRTLANAAHQPSPPVTATVARINEGNRAAERVERLARDGDPVTRLCLSAMQALSLQCSSAACHHPLMELAG